tara:strand:- start:2450 stop:3550 length:1101 start_codon:yes stop_codon:yes gene_type:complete
MKNKVYFFSGSRADYSLIESIFFLFQYNKSLEKKLVITGTNLSKKYSDNEKFDISEKYIHRIYVKLGNSQEKNFSNIFSKYLGQFYKLLEKNKPNYVILLGDRYEALIFGICAKFLNIKIIHFHGGETTLGSLDNTWRDMISRLSDYHFTSLKLYKDKLINMGIDKKKIFNVGSIGVSNISKTKIKKKFTFPNSLNFDRKILVSYHSLTTSISKSRKDLNELLSALFNFKNDFILFTYPGHDSDSDYIISRIKIFNKLNKNSLLIRNAKLFSFSTLLKSFDIFVGNSSAGIIEAPTAKIPTINIGKRQKGRISGKSVFHVEANNKKISNEIDRVLGLKKISFVNPYYKKKTMIDIYKKILVIIKNT